MKKFIYVLILLLITNTAFASAIYTTADGTRLKCTSTMQRGSLTEYKNKTTVDYYIFKNGELYSDNLSKMFGNPQKPPKHVYNLQVSNQYITFKDRLYRWSAFHYKWVTINRQNGSYYFEAKKDCNWFHYQKAYNNGKCQIIK